MIDDCRCFHKLISASPSVEMHGSRLSLCLRHQHSIWALVRILEAPLLIQLLAGDLGKAVEDCPMVCTLTGDLEATPGSGFPLAQPRPLRTFRE